MNFLVWFENPDEQDSIKMWLKDDEISTFHNYSRMVSKLEKHARDYVHAAQSINHAQAGFSCQFSTEHKPARW